MRVIALLSLIGLSACAHGPDECNRTLRTAAIVAGGVAGAGLAASFFRPELGIPMQTISYATAAAAGASVGLFVASGCPD